jgi:transposase-like protein
MVPARTKEVDMGEQPDDSIQRWTAKRRAALVLSLLKGETSVAEAARQHGLTVAEVEDWRDRFLLGAENALRSRPKDDEALRDEQLKKLKQKIGELVLDNDILREALKPYPLARGTSDESGRAGRTSRNGGPVSSCRWGGRVCTRGRGVRRRGRGARLS